MNDKNMADVADKAVDKLANGFNAIAAAVNKVAPHAWDLAVRQQRIDAVTSLVSCGVLVAAALILLWISSKWWRSENEDRSGFSISSAVVCACFCVLILAFWVPKYAHRYLNAEYFAAKEILEAVK